MTAYTKILSHSQHSSAWEQGFGLDTLLIKVKFVEMVPTGCRWNKKEKADLLFNKNAMLEAKI